MLDKASSVMSSTLILMSFASRAPSQHFVLDYIDIGFTFDDEKDNDKLVSQHLEKVINEMYCLTLQSAEPPEVGEFQFSVWVCLFLKQIT